MTYECVVFLLTPLREGRRKQKKLWTKEKISTHAPAGGATQARHSGRRKWYHFYSRPCGRGDWRDVSRQAGFHKISTHAPAGGATCQRVGSHAGNDIISTHAPAGGATLGIDIHSFLMRNFYSRPCGRGDSRRRSWPKPKRNFYSRPCGRGDPLTIADEYDQAGISTHAPAGGATIPTSIFLVDLKNFYSHPCGRGDSRPPFLRQTLQSYFYSRPCGRGDLNDCDLLARRCRISTHAPAGGATHRPKPLPSFLSYISTHAPAGGATFCKNGSVMLPFSFLLTPLREGRLHLRHQARELGGFLLTPLREGRRSSRHGG